MHALHEQPVACAIAERLRQLMTAKGYTSDRNRSGVDVAALSKGAGVSYEMARRYAEGLAVPRPDVLASIARWLHVDMAALAYGAECGDVDADLLERCVKAVTDAQQEAGLTLPADQTARLVAQLYAEARHGDLPKVGQLATMLRAFFTTTR